jgi:hypothetical protein
MEQTDLQRIAADAARDDEVRQRVMDEQAERESRRRIPGGNAMSHDEYEALIAKRMTADQEQALYERRLSELNLRGAVHV